MVLPAPAAHFPPFAQQAMMDFMAKKDAEAKRLRKGQKRLKSTPAPARALVVSPSSP